MTRRLWMAASLLAAVAAAWLYLSFGPDYLLWAWSRLIAPAAALPAAVPATRIADALLLAVVIAFVVGFVPLSLAAWMQGAHLTSLARAAAAAAESGADEVSAARLAMLRAEAERQSPWQLLLQFDLVGMADDSHGSAQRRASMERGAIVSDLVAHQSAASLFRGLALICLCLGLFALVAQTISNLLGTDLLQRPAKGLELAATRGLLSAVTAVVVAGFIDLVARLVNATIRQRAETLGRRFDRLGRNRRRLNEWDREPVLSAEPIPPLSSGRAGDIDDIADRTEAMLERSQRQISARIDDALQSLSGDAIRPMLQEVSRVLATLSTQTGNMVEAVDRRLAEQHEDARRLAEITATAREEMAHQTAAMLERSHRQLAASLETAVERIAEAAARPLQQEVSGLLANLNGQVETIAAALDRHLAGQRDDTRRVAEAADALREEMARQTALLAEPSHRQLVAVAEGGAPALAAISDQGVSDLIGALRAQADSVAEALDRRLAEQRDDTRRIADAAEAMRGEVARQTTFLVEQSQRQVVPAAEAGAPVLAAAMQPVLQEVSDLIGALRAEAEAIAGALDRRLAEQHAEIRRIVETAGATREDIAAQTAALLERSHAQIGARVDGALQSLGGATVRPVLQEVSRLLELLSGQAGTLVETLDRRLAEQREDNRQAAEATAAGTRQLAALLAELQQVTGRSTGAVAERLDRLIASQETLRQAARPAPSAPVGALAPGRPAGAADPDPLAMLSRLLADSRRTGGQPAPEAPARNGAAAAEGDWARRLADLSRSTADLTRDLPMLRPGGSS